MYKMCKTEQSAARQRELEEGLLAMMLTKHYDEISVSDLCEHIGIPRKSFYRYFSGKEGALHALIDHTLLGYESFSFPQSGGEKRTAQNDLERYFQFWLLQKPLLDAMSKSGLSGVLIERSIAHAVSDVGTSSRFSPQSEKTARRQAIMFGVCGLMSMMLEWHSGGYAVPPRQMAQLAVKLLTEPLFLALNG